MNEDTGVQESSKCVADLKLTFRNGKVQAQVTAVADSVQEAVELAERVSNQWLRRGQGKNDVTEIAEIGTVVVSKEVAMAEDQEVAAVGVTGNSNPQAIGAIRTLTEAMPFEDLATIAGVVVQELARRRGTEDTNTFVADLLKVHDNVAGSEAPASPTTVGDTVDND